ncbi:dephospho-CoA kinase [Ulvibacter litoralis]|uniref:Dephospho-CoA kinase n=1 Tax=Ulvibacter litoralis TaxID=227084 RepID=A0A1G7ENA6_9FLAO|nr:dephospho-CoA kinase [Ulvibacter litoralis]GHC54553.1 dephospho-CoA kinase [Ulvibacter litoralis]SDE64865.1 dephospho-CoA kinase [Ulvibacter litoralis]
MKIVGLTGGIGSGKTTVAAMFKELGVPVYIADDEAKKLTNTSKVIRRKLIALLGEEAYVDGALNRKFVASKIFNDTELLQQVNAIIHPKVGAHFKRWVKKQDAPYCIKEVAILFENGSYKQCDVTILVVSPLEVRINRVMQRDNTSEEAVLERVKNQWTDAEKSKLATIIIENKTLSETKKQVQKIHASLQ